MHAWQYAIKWLNGVIENKSWQLNISFFEVFLLSLLDQVEQLLSNINCTLSLSYITSTVTLHVLIVFGETFCFAIYLFISFCSLPGKLSCKKSHKNFQLSRLTFHQNNDLYIYNIPKFQNSRLELVIEMNLIRR